MPPSQTEASLRPVETRVVPRARHDVVDLAESPPLPTSSGSQRTLAAEQSELTARRRPPARMGIACESRAVVSGLTGAEHERLIPLSVVAASPHAVAEARIWSHGSTPWIGTDQMPATATIVSSAGQLYRQVSAFDPVTISFGHIDDVGRQNVIGEVVTLWGTIRCSIDADMAEVQKRLRRLAEGTAASYGCTATAEYLIENPPSTTHPRGSRPPSRACGESSAMSVGRSATLACRRRRLLRRQQVRRSLVGVRRPGHDDRRRPARPGRRRPRRGAEPPPRLLRR
jgi:hypothetical protein